MSKENSYELEKKRTAFRNSNGTISTAGNESVLTEDTQLEGSVSEIANTKDVGVEIITEDKKLEVDDLTAKYLIYGVNDSPPIHVTIICALQVCSFLF